MADTGAPWNIPYVEPGDLVRDYPSADEAQALAIAAGLTAAGPAGIGDNVVTVSKTDTFTESVAQGAISAAAISVSITPSSDTSKVLVVASVNIAAQAQDQFSFATLFRDGSVVFRGDAASNRQRVTAFAWQMDGNASNVSIVFLDSPAKDTSTTYDIRLSHGAGATRPVFLNRSFNDTDNNTFGRGASSITVIEVKA